jgi:hypothetical protein
MQEIFEFSLHQAFPLLDMAIITQYRSNVANIARLFLSYETVRRA